MPILGDSRQGGPRFGVHGFQPFKGPLKRLRRGMYVLLTHGDARMARYAHNPECPHPGFPEARSGGVA
jgi:hypothetical protein